VAINKKQASPAVKIGIILVAVLLVAAFALPLISPNAFNGQSADDTSGSGQLESIAASHSGAVTAFQQQLASDPTSYTVLVNLGNTYSDWASQILQYQGNSGGADLPVWIATTVYYQRALDVQSGDPAVMTDLAIAYFYSGQWNEAVATVSAAVEADPEFAPAYYNAMIFYDSAGDAVMAATNAARYLELDPQGQSTGDPAVAQRIVDESGSVATSTP